MKFTILMVLMLAEICKAQPGDPSVKAIVQRLGSANDSHSRRELVELISSIDESAVSSSERKKIGNALLNWYSSDPDALVHSAIDQLLRYPKTGRNAGKVSWILPYKLDQIDKEQSGVQGETKRWFVTSTLQVMSIVDGPVKFVMGSPKGEEDRTDDEVQHEVIISRTFAVSTKEITVAQFQTFLNANPGVLNAAIKQDSLKSPSIGNQRLLKFSPEPECPQIFVSWYEAALYCNWLSKLEGIPEKEWCYIQTDGNGGLVIPKDQLQRKGYRLPTEAEWEFAARAGTTTSRFYGDQDELLSDYAWYSRNPPVKKSDPIDPDDPHHTYPVGQLKPNPLGLFDVYGNVWEWCNSTREPYTEGITSDELPGDISITDAVAMVRRGGSFAYAAGMQRSAHRGVLGYLPNQKRDNVGFRIAKTVDRR